MNCHFLRISDDEEDLSKGEMLYGQMAGAHGGCWNLVSFNPLAYSVCLLVPPVFQNHKLLS